MTVIAKISTYFSYNCIRTVIKKYRFVTYIRAALITARRFECSYCSLTSNVTVIFII
jgi:hypothetical protein